MKIKTVLISIIGFSIVGLSVYKLNASPQAVIQTKTAQLIAKHEAPELTNEINTSGHWKLSVESPAPKQAFSDEVAVEYIKIEPNTFDHLQNGEKLTIHIPQEQQDYVGTVEKSYEQFGGQVKVSTGSIENGQQFSSFTVTKGPELTLVMVATGEKIYQVEINNKTGIGTVIDDQALDVFRQHDDGQATPPEGIS